MEHKKSKSNHQMSAETFFHFSSGNTAQEAFIAAVEEAEYDHGHSGYTGTIAEKDTFVMIPMPKKRFTKGDAEAYANELIRIHDGRIDDKWGDAGCIDCGQSREKGAVTGEHLFLFFGWASS